MSSSASSAPPSSTNPMLNPDILDALFEVCDATPDEFCHYRLVCTDWAQASQKAWRRSFTTLRVEGYDDPELDPNASLASLLQQHSSSSKYVITVGLSQFLGLQLRAEEGSNGRRRMDSSTGGRQLFCNFHLYLWTPAHVSLEAGLQFWRACGAWIKRMELEFIHFEDINRLRSIIFRETPNLLEFSLRMCRLQNDSTPPSETGGRGKKPVVVQGKLEALKLKDPFLAESGGSYVRYWPLDWNEIFASFPNLKTLSLQNFPSRDERARGGDDGEQEEPIDQRSTYFERMLRAIIDERRRTGGCLQSLVNIEVGDAKTFIVSQSIADLVREVNSTVALERLKIEVGGVTEEGMLRQLLGLHGTTLRKLECFRDSGDFSTVPIPYDDVLGGVLYEHLVELRLCGPVAANFSFFQHTPALQVLHILSSNFIGGSLFKAPAYAALFDSYHPVVIIRSSADGGSGAGNNDQVSEDEELLRMEKLTEFKTDLWIEDPSKFLKLTKWMPFITRLSVPLDGATFGVVCTLWVDTLKELHFPFGTQIGDEELTGISPQDRENPDVARPANITNLKELGKFSQDKSRDRGYRSGVAMTFTEHAVTHGFLLLPKLRSLQLFVDQETTAVVIRELLQEKIHHMDIRECKEDLYN